MIQIELTRPESQLLLQILEEFLAGLAVERATGGIDQVSDSMQDEETVVQKVLAQLNEQGTETPKEMLGEYSG